MQKWEYSVIGDVLSLVSVDGEQKFPIIEKKAEDMTGKETPARYKWQGSDAGHTHTKQILDLDASSPQELRWKTLALMGKLGWEGWAISSDGYALKRAI